MNAIIRKILLAQIRSAIDENFTTKNVMRIFAATLARLQDWAKSTGTVLDDWILDMLTPYAIDEAFAASFVATVKSIVNKSGICAATGNNAEIVDACTAWCQLAPEVNEP